MALQRTQKTAITWRPIDNNLISIIFYFFIIRRRSDKTHHEFGTNIANSNRKQRLLTL